MENIVINQTDGAKTNYNIVNKVNFHQKLTEFKNLIKSSNTKIIMLNVVDSLNLNYSKSLDNIISNSKIKQADLNFFDEVFFPNIIGKMNSQILFFEISILYESANSQYDTETFLIPSIKFHKFLSESFLNLNPSLFNFFSNNKNLFDIKKLLDVETLSYMTNSLNNILNKNFDKIRKFGKPTKNEYKKSYYFFPKGLNDPIINTKKRLENFFIKLYNKIIEIKADEKKHLENLQNNIFLPVEKFYFKDEFSIEKIFEFKYIFFFKKYDEKFLNLKFSCFKLIPLLSEEEINGKKYEDIEKNDISLLKFSILLLKKIYLDLEFILIKLYNRLGKKNEKIEEFNDNVLKKIFNELNYSMKEKGQDSNFSLFLSDEFLVLLKNGDINEIYFNFISNLISNFLKKKLSLCFDINKEKNKLGIKYFLTQAPSEDILINIFLVKEILRSLIYFLNNNFISIEKNFHIFDDSEINYKLINSLYSYVEKETELRLSNSNNNLKISKNTSLTNENKNSCINLTNNHLIDNEQEIKQPKSKNVLEFDKEKIKTNISKMFYIDDEEKFYLNYEMFSKLGIIIPNKLYKIFSPNYEILLDIDISYISNIDPKKIDNITYESLFLKINKEKDILFDYDIETTIYKFLEHDIILYLKKNKQNDYLYYSRMSSDMKKFYTDLKSFLMYDNGLFFKKNLEENIFEDVFRNFSFTDKLDFEINSENINYNNIYDYLEILEKEKNLLEKKNQLLKLFIETKAEFLKKEEMGVFNFIEEIFGSESDMKKSLIVGIDLNSILIKIFNEMYISHNSIYKEYSLLCEEKIDEFKTIFLEKFLTKQYLDLNYLFNKYNLHINYGINENDFQEIISVYLENRYFKGKIEKRDNKHNLFNDKLKSITKNISEFIKTRMLSKNLKNLEDFIENLGLNNCLNIFYLSKQNNYIKNKKELKLIKFPTNTNNITLEIEEEEKIDEMKNNYSFVIKYDKDKKKLVIDYLKKIVDFYVTYNLSKIQI